MEFCRARGCSSQVASRCADCGKEFCVNHSRDWEPAVGPTDLPTPDQLSKIPLCRDCSSSRDAARLGQHIQILRDRGISPELAALALAASPREGRAYDHGDFLTPRAKAIVRELSRPDDWVDTEPDIAAFLRSRLSAQFVDHPAMTALLYDRNRLFRKSRDRIHFSGTAEISVDREGAHWLAIWSDQDWSYRGASWGSTILGNEVRVDPMAWPDVVSARARKDPHNPGFILRRLGVTPFIY